MTRATDETPNHRLSHGPARLLYLLLGGLTLALGLIGVVLPLLPSTVFFLVAAWAFARSSPRARAWLMNHGRFGPPLRRWQTHGAIHPRAKFSAVALIGISYIITAVFADLPTVGFVVLGGFLAGLSVWIIARPDGPADA